MVHSPPVFSRYLLSYFIPPLSYLTSIFSLSSSKFLFHIKGLSLFLCQQLSLNLFCGGESMNFQILQNLSPSNLYNQSLQVTAQLPGGITTLHSLIQVLFYLYSAKAQSFWIPLLTVNDIVFSVLVIQYWLLLCIMLITVVGVCLLLPFHFARTLMWVGGVSCYSLNLNSIQTIWFCTKVELLHETKIPSNYIFMVAQRFCGSAPSDNVGTSFFNKYMCSVAG